MSNAYPGAASQPLYSSWLRTGGLLTVWTDRLQAGSTVYPLADIVGAALVADPAAPPTPGSSAAAAVYLRLKSGQSVIPITLSPAVSADSWRILEAIYALRVDLRTTLPPNPDLSTRAGQSVQSFLADPGSEKLFAGIAHLSYFFLPIVLPLVIWLACKDKMAYASSQGKQAFWFHILISATFLGMFVLIGVIGLVLTLLAGALGLAGAAAASGSGSPLPFLPFFSVGGILGLLLFAVLWIGAVAISVLGLVLAVNGAIKAFNGKPFHYPFLGRI